MATNNYTTMSNQELLDCVFALNKRIDQITIFLKHHNKDLLLELIKRTEFLNVYFETKNAYVPISARLYCLKYDLSYHPICKNQNCPNKNKVNWSRGENKFCDYCCAKCAASDEIVKQKHQKTSSKKYGTSNPSQSDVVKNKIVQTNLKNWGVVNVGQNEQIKQKIKSTNIHRRGVSCSFQDETVKIKIKETNNIRYGCDYYAQTEESKEHIKNIWDKKSRSEIDDINERRKQTLQKNLGVSHQMLSDNVKKKMRETILKKHGVEYYSQTEEYHKKVHKKYSNPKYPDMTFGSSWEFLVYDFLLENHIDFEYQPAISLPYEYQGTQHTYHPDFRIGNRIVEVKGDNFFRINESTGKEEMFCPWRGDLSDEEYE